MSASPMSTGPASKLALIDGPDLAEALNVPTRAVSLAVDERQSCRGYPLYNWIRYGPDGTVKGYDVPVLARLALELPPFEDAADAETDVLVDRIVRLITAKVMREVSEELRPWLARLVTQQLRSEGTGRLRSPSAADASPSPPSPSEEESDAESDDAPEPTSRDNPSSILEEARKSLEAMREDETDDDETPDADVSAMAGERRQQQERENPRSHKVRAGNR